MLSGRKEVSSDRQLEDVAKEGEAMLFLKNN